MEWGKTKGKQKNIPGIALAFGYSTKLPDIMNENGQSDILPISFEILALSGYFVYIGQFKFE